MKKINTIIFGAAAISLLSFGVASATITSSLDLGDKNSQVTELQTYLSTNSAIYPSGLVTGYFGGLTQAAVQRFQAAQGIVSSGSPATTGYGRVGPATMARINSLNGGAPQSGAWDPVPFLSVPSVNVNNNSATITWTTNEATIGQVYYDMTPLRGDEETGNHQLPYLSGFLVGDNGGYQINYSVTISNLAANTNYYFAVRAIDSGSNMSMTWPSTSFRTSN
jgi:peptidoglycan hydrolase-like protein with peptidoglycan-binding domain